MLSYILSPYALGCVHHTVYTQNIMTKQMYLYAELKYILNMNGLRILNKGKGRVKALNYYSRSVFDAVPT